MKPFHFIVPIAAVVIITIVSIAYSFPSRKKSPDNQQNAVYYWRTTFELNEVEKQFLHLKEVRKSLNDYFQKEIKLSSTIRLHQLAQTPPDVDYGVLMYYNTGNFKDYKTEISILDIKDVKPYLKYLKSYDLPLTLGLPVYEWNVAGDSESELWRLFVRGKNIQHGGAPVLLRCSLRLQEMRASSLIFLYFCGLVLTICPSTLSSAIPMIYTALW